MFKKVLCKLTDLSSFSDDQKEAFKEYIERKSCIFEYKLTKSVYYKDENVRRMFESILNLITNDIESKYGDFDFGEYHPYPIPIINDLHRSGLLMFEEEFIGCDCGIFISSQFDTWERVFYQICHEAIHLLNPIFSKDKSSPEASALDEGVAVTYAEVMYEKYISPYQKMFPVDSPKINKISGYYKAWNATRKIPDSALRSVREYFGSFKAINDVDKFRTLTHNYISGQEIIYLSSSFKE